MRTAVYFTRVALDIAHFRPYASVMQYTIFQTSSLLPLRMSLTRLLKVCYLLLVAVTV